MAAISSATALTTLEQKDKCHFVIPTEGRPGGEICLAELHLGHLAYPVIRYYHIKDCKCPTPTTINEFTTLVKNVIGQNIKDLDAAETAMVQLCVGRLTQPSPKDIVNITTCVHDIFHKKMAGVSLTMGGVFSLTKFGISDDTYLR